MTSSLNVISPVSNDFNSHAHVERDYHFICPYLCIGDFNSHAHVERDQPYKLSDDFSDISTHTLTWSVTVAKSSIKGITIISTHTLTWSVTLSVLIKR